MRFDGKAEEFNANGYVNWARQWVSDVYNLAKELNLPKCHGSVPGWYLVKNHPECLKSVQLVDKARFRIS